MCRRVVFRIYAELPVVLSNAYREMLDGKKSEMMFLNSLRFLISAGLGCSGSELLLSSGSDLSGSRQKASEGVMGCTIVPG